MIAASTVLDLSAMQDSNQSMSLLRDRLRGFVVLTRVDAGVDRNVGSHVAIISEVNVAWTRIECYSNADAMMIERLLYFLKC